MNYSECSIKEEEPTMTISTSDYPPLPAVHVVVAKQICQTVPSSSYSTIQTNSNYYAVPQQQQLVAYPHQEIQMVPMMMVPTMTMDRSDLNNYASLLVKQTKKGWVQECFCWQAQKEFNIAPKHLPKDNVLYSLEDSSCCARFCCPQLHPFTMNLSKVNSSDPKLAQYDHPCACILCACKCCCYQRLDVSTLGVPAGTVQESCYYCVPNFKVITADGTHQYDIHEPTCCGGMCVNCCAEGCYIFRRPFYIFPPGASGSVGSQSGRLVKVRVVLDCIDRL